MNKKMREILALIQTKTDEAKAFMSGENKDLDKANALMDEIDTLRKEYETEERLFGAEKLSQSVVSVDPVEDHASEKEVEISDTELLAKSVRAIMAPAKYANDKALVESIDANGGYTVPEDIQTAVNHWADVEYSFLNEISEESVTTNKGARTYQAKGETQAFYDLDESGSIATIGEEGGEGVIEAPKFERVTFAIQDRAGFMPVSNDLISDSDANISAIVTEWLGRANIATVNAKVLAILGAHKNPKADGTFESVAGATAIENGIDGIKQIVNVILGQTYKSASKIITNDDGLQYLDTLKDENGRPMLNPDPTDSAKLALRCGTTVVPITVIPNKILASTGANVPMIIGDLKAGIRRYNRQSMTLEASTVATIGSFNAFAQNMTLIRAILRDDYKELDKCAYYYGTIDTTPAKG